MPETYVPDNLQISDELFQLFVEFIYDFAGIRLNDQKKTLVTSRFQKRLRALGLTSYHDYYKRVKLDQDECVMMLNCITTNTTKFFRENHHFELLRDELIPSLLESRRSTRKIRIWSAGCSTGEEPYSIAISVWESFLECFPDADPYDPFCGWDVRILATDISTDVLAAAQRGLYNIDQIPAGVPKELLQRYFLKGSKDFSGMVTVKEMLKRIIRFRRLNFKDATYPFSGKFDIIFCRNVMIYFDEAMKSQLLNKFHHYLAHDGHLFLGHSETMFASNQFSPVGITVYRRH
ncbi:protein-glutamate O-methyltransferase CheR [Geobacter pelophilus]|uniref:protein-glutamate O-methyltransferase n=1 Tax=Geoanaerobacter pelophilus TaxID=60036 RepID=A0AAW4L189_9BACT|nr:protein-glutamate O-methyltransferase CheR [Geoanaerobacter pelophilus]MBT0664726.1 protein-glutamate O-methyltransferase CheR [Geoanaerobacter pelophilus]